MTTGGAGRKPCILIYGGYAALLRTRRWVLEAGGFDVAVAGTEMESELLLRSCIFALFILCHSLSADARRVALMMAASVNPATRLLLLTTGSASPSDAPFDAMEGPEALLDLVRRLLTAQPGQSAFLHIVARRQ